MKQTLIKAAVLAASISLVVSCSSSNTQSENTTIGAVTGAVVGGVAGSAIGAGTGTAVAVGVGIVGGALIGGMIGHSMDHSDNVQASYALEHTQKKKSHHWKNKKTGTHYTVTPTSKQMAMNGQSNCRKYAITAVANGKSQKTDAIACRQPDGSWQAYKA